MQIGFSGLMTVSPIENSFSSGSITTTNTLPILITMANTAGAPLVLNATISGMSRERVAELNRAYEERMTAKKAEKEQKKAMKRAMKEKKRTRDSEARTLWEQEGYKFIF